MSKITNEVILFVLLILSAYFDVTKKKIPNFITLTVMLWSLLAYTILDGFKGFQFSTTGILVGLGIFIIPFIIGGMGGGDVKLMGAIGAIMGWRFALLTAIYAGLVGGVIVIIIIIRQKKFLMTMKRVLAIILKPLMFVLTLNFENNKLRQFNNWLLDSQINWDKQYIPYGVAIGIGAIIALQM